MMSIGGRLFLMATKLVTKGGQYLVGEVAFAARAEAFAQRGTEDHLKKPGPNLSVHPPGLVSCR